MESFSEAEGVVVAELGDKIAANDEAPAKTFGLEVSVSEVEAVGLEDSTGIILDEAGAVSLVDSSTVEGFGESVADVEAFVDSSLDAGAADDDVVEALAFFVSVASVEDSSVGVELVSSVGVGDGVELVVSCSVSNS